MDKNIELIPIPELESDNYLADIFNGRIWNVKAERWVNSNPNKRFGYCYSSFDGKPYSIHTLIMSAVLDQKKEWWRQQGLEINHISKDKSDNSMSNLELVNRKQQYEDEEVRAKLGKGKRLSIHEVKEIKYTFDQLLNEGELKTSQIINFLSEQYSVTYSAIENIIKGKTHRKITA